MNTPTPTPRTDSAWAKTFDEDENQCRAGNAASDMRDECATLERELAALTTERDHLHAQLHALTLICGTNDANKFETWIDRANARAERAEAELAAEREKSERYRLATLKLDAELATERARLRDLWCEMALEYRDERISYVSVQITRSVWDELDAAMKEGAK